MNCVSAGCNELSIFQPRPADTNRVKNILTSYVAFLLIGVESI